MSNANIKKHLTEAPAASQPAVNDWIEKVQDRVEEADQTVRSFVKKSPFLATAIALGIGFAGSLLVDSLRSQHETQ